MHNQLGGIWGEYCVEVIKSGGASYYPFGEKPIKNVILDSFFQRILSFTGFPHGIETLVGGCVTSTGADIPATKSDTGLHGLANDFTRASSSFLRELNTGENRTRMTRDFIFPTLTGEREYGEACVGMIDIGGSSDTIFKPDMPVSHFVFPGVVGLDNGDSLKIIYSLNLVLDYLSTGQRISLTGDGFDFNGQLKWAGTIPHVFSHPEGAGVINTGIHTLLGGAGGGLSVRYRPFADQASNIITQNYSIFSTATKNYNICSQNTLFGGILGGGSVEKRIAVFFTGAYTGGLGDRYSWQSTSTNTYSLPSSDPSINNFQIYESGASVDVSYYFPPVGFTRTCSGIFLNFRITTNGNDATQTNGLPYILFDTPQTIPAEQPISMKLRWYFNRL